MLTHIVAALFCVVLLPLSLTLAGEAETAKQDLRADSRSTHF
jgi:hypothetical protein